MADLALLCPDCGDAVTHSCGAIPSQMVAQSSLIVGANPEIAHVSGSSGSPKSRTYNKGYDQHFLGFWDIYPLKRDKRKAQNAWRKAVAKLVATTGANPVEAMAQIIQGAVAYRDDPNRVDQFTKYAEGWLNGECWDDAPLPPRNSNGKAQDTAGLALRKIQERQHAG